MKDHRAPNAPHASDGKNMIDWSSIRDFCDSIVEQFRPEKIVLFGSYAFGQPDEYSDVDILVILPFEGKGAEKALEILNCTNPGFPVDLLVRTRNQIRQRVAHGDVESH